MQHASGDIAMFTPHQRCVVHDDVFNLRTAGSVEMVVGNRLKGFLENLSNSL